jgi:hypothetical protein
MLIEVDGVAADQPRTPGPDPHRLVLDDRAHTVRRT